MTLTTRPKGGLVEGHWSMSEELRSAKTWLEWDGKIPAWGLLALGMSAVLYGWSWVNDIEKRLTTRELQAIYYQNTLDELRKDQPRLTQLEVEIKYIRLGIERMETRLLAREQREQREGSQK